MARHQGKKKIFALWFAYGTPSGTKLKIEFFYPVFGMARHRGINLNFSYMARHWGNNPF